MLWCVIQVVQVFHGDLFFLFLNGDHLLLGVIIWTCASEEEAIINDTDYCFSSAPEVL